ncbi:MAG TPA: hypothetical protein VGA51_12345 [Casimicrobiaceae bacterium]
MNHAAGEHRDPAAGDFEVLLADPQKSKNAFGDVVEARHELAEVVALMQCLQRLPALSRLERRRITSKSDKHCQDVGIDRLAQRRRELHLPHQRGEHRNHVRRVKPRIVSPDHV